MSRPLLIALIVAYLAALHLAAIAGVYVYSRDQGINHEAFKQTLYAFYLRRDQGIPNGSVVFLGDSHTHALCTSCVAPNAVNYGIPSLTSQELLIQAAQYQALGQASTILIQIGHNDLKTAGDEDVINAVQQLLTEMPPETRQIITLQFPVDESVHQRLTGYNARKQVLNDAIKRICKSPCEPLDLWPRLYQDQQIVQRYFLADGIHLSAEGNALWAKELRDRLDA